MRHHGIQSPELRPRVACPPSIPEFPVKSERSVIPCKILAQLVNPEAGLAGLDLQKQLRGRQLIVEVEGCRSIRIANQMKSSIDLFAFRPQRLRSEEHTSELQ